MADPVFMLVVQGQQPANPGGPPGVDDLPLEGVQNWLGGLKKDAWQPSAQQLMSHSCARRGKIGVQTAETTGGTATQRIYITVNWQNYRQLPCHSFTPTLLQWTRRRFHAFSCTEGHTWEGKPGSVSRGCLGFLVCLQSRRCYTVFFLDFFLFFFGDRIPQISIQMLNKIVNQRESWRGMHWN